MPLPTGLVVKNGSNTLADDIGRNANAGVRHGDRDIVACRQLFPVPEVRVPDLDRDRAALRHGVARIDHEVDQRDLEFGDIDDDRPRVGGEIDNAA